MVDKKLICRFIVLMTFLSMLYIAAKYTMFECADNYEHEEVHTVYDNSVPRSVCRHMEVQKVKVQKVKVNPNPTINLGEFKLTAYCDCQKCCGKTDGITATGTKATQGRTIAVDPNVIPYGSEVIINGHTYIAEDCGGAIDNKHIDVFFEDHEEALLFGVNYANVYLKKGDV